LFLGCFFSLWLCLCVCVKGARLWNNVDFIWSHNLRNVCSPLFIIFLGEVHNTFLFLYSWGIELLQE
jgi:hypothetical protein